VQFPSISVSFGCHLLSLSIALTFSYSFRVFFLEVSGDPCSELVLTALDVRADGISCHELVEKAGIGGIFSYYPIFLGIKSTYESFWRFKSQVKYLKR
jgi:hypothetical protein